MGNFTTKAKELRVINFDENNNHFYYGQVSPNSKQPKGKGKYYFEDGSVYYGDFKNNSFYGEGVLNSVSDGSIYKGNFKNNSREGFGELTFKNGDKYIGNFELDEMQGKGKYIYNNGCYYEGNFMLGKMSGKGKLFSQIDELIYDGEFLNNLRSGFGISYKDNKINYIGNWFKDTYHGVGLVFDENGLLLCAGVFDSQELMEELDYVPEYLVKYLRVKEIIVTPKSNEELESFKNDMKDVKDNKNIKQVPSAPPVVEPVLYNPLNNTKNNIIPLVNIQDPTEVKTGKPEIKVVSNPIYDVINAIQSKHNMDLVNSPKSTFNPIQIALKKST